MPSFGQTQKVTVCIEILTVQMCIMSYFPQLASVSLGPKKENSNMKIKNQGWKINYKGRKKCPLYAEFWMVKEDKWVASLTLPHSFAQRHSESLQ